MKKCKSLYLKILKDISWKCCPLTQLSFHPLTKGLTRAEIILSNHSKIMFQKLLLPKISYLHLTKTISRISQKTIYLGSI